MEQKKLRVGVLFGGKSVEHEVSLISAGVVIEALDPEKYEIVLIGIDKQGQWHVRDQNAYVESSQGAKKIALTQSQAEVIIRTSEHTLCTDSPLALDVVLPMLHGSCGEDGTIQGFLRLVNIPFVGADVLGSAIGMDKDVTKRLLRDAGLAIAPFVTIHRHERDQWTFERLSQHLTPPFFVKPACAGSSVGVTKVLTKEDLNHALTEAFRYDKKVLVEEAIPGIELVCGVMGNEHPLTSVPGEVELHDQFYTYDTKYFDPSGSTYHIPARISAEQTQLVQQTAAQVYRTLCCEGMARVDFFLTPEGKLIVNELNSIPGFTPRSTYPRLWAATGVSCTQLLDHLIGFAIERHQADSSIHSSVL